MKRTLYTAGLVVALTATAQAELLANFNFENAQAGDLLDGPIGTERYNDASKGAGFPFDNSAISRATVSALTMDGRSGGFKRTAANVRRDTLTAEQPGGQFLEISPHHTANLGYSDMKPDDSVDYMVFSIQAPADHQLNLESFSFDLGCARGSQDSAPLGFRGQGWFSLDEGITWNKMRKVAAAMNKKAESFTGFTTVKARLGGFSALQNQTGKVHIALCISDNSSRSVYRASDTSPAAHYLDNIKLAGTIVPVAPAVAPTAPAAQ